MCVFARAAMIAALMLATSAMAVETGDAQLPAAPEVQPKASNRPLRGTIVAMNIETKTLTVQTRKGSELVDVVVETGRSTQFLLDQAEVTLVDLRKGMRVVVLPDVGLATKVVANRVKQPPKRTEDKRSTSQG